MSPTTVLRRPNPTERELLREIESTVARKLELLDQLAEKRSNRYLTCINQTGGRLGCGRRSKIKNCTYRQTHWYVRPYSCTGGDYWREGEGEWVCPHCNTICRLYDRPEIQRLKRLFREVVGVYDD